MNMNCSCGGRLRRIGIVGREDLNTGRVYYHDTDPVTAHFACTSCGKERKQRKRKTAVPPIEVNQGVKVLWRKVCK